MPPGATLPHIRISFWRRLSPSQSPEIHGHGSTLSTRVKPGMSTAMIARPLDLDPRVRKRFETKAGQASVNSASFCESESAGQILRRYLTSTSRCFHNLGTDVLSSWVQGCDTHVLKNATRHGAGYMLQSSLLEFKRLCGPSSGHPQGGLGPRFRPITCITSSQSQEGTGESRRSRSSIPALQNVQSQAS